MDKQTIVDKLSAFGAVKGGQYEWADYSGCGFTAADAPTLVAVAADENLSNAEGDEVWIPLHAWRALLPLMPAGLLELLPVLNLLAEDDWASTDLPKVLAAAGEVALEPLHAFIRDTGNAEYARSMAIGALGEIATENAGLGEQVASLLVDCLQAGATDDQWVNSALVSGLIDLEAVDAIGVIRAAYAADKVDWGFCGDLEDVELALGLREERDTPRPRYNLFGDGKRPEPPSLEPVAANISAEERVERIQQFLDYYGTQESVGTATELHGFFTAIGCAPEPVPPREWLPALWGGEDLAPAWPDTQSVQVFLNLLMPFYNGVMGELLNVNTFTIPFDEYAFGEGSFTDYGGWCRGFDLGLGVGPFPTMDIPGAGKFLDELANTYVGATNTSIGMSPAERKAREKNLNHAVRAICILGRGGQVTAGAPVRATTKVGRNDLCPCGSGKKYKKCCLH